MHAARFHGRVREWLQRERQTKQLARERTITRLVSRACRDYRLDAEDNVYVIRDNGVVRSPVVSLH